MSSEPRLLPRDLLQGLYHHRVLYMEAVDRQ
jgi:hypothetical protein